MIGGYRVYDADAHVILAPARENAAQNLLGRHDVTEVQKQKTLYENPVRFFGEP